MANLTKLLIFSLLFMLADVLPATSLDQLKSQINQIANDARQEFKLPALAISVRLPLQQKIDIYQGSAKKYVYEPINSNTLFQVGSTTKTFTAVLILKLAAQHRLNLNDPLSKWLPQYPQWSKVTLLQLLNHTSGIYDYINSPFWWFRLEFFNRTKVWTDEELVKIAYSHSLICQPGEGWQYSNTDYILLGMIIEKATKLPFKEALNQYVLNNSANHLSHTFYILNHLPPEIKQHLAHGYRNNVNDMTTINTSWLAAGGGLISNAHDLANWFEDIFNHKALAKNQLPQMLKFVSLHDGQRINNFNEAGYGLGIFSAPTPYGLLWFTPGLAPGYMSLVAWIPCKKIAFAYTTNNVSTQKSLHRYLINRLLAVLADDKSQQCKNEPKTKVFKFPRF